MRTRRIIRLNKLIYLPYLCKNIEIKISSDNGFNKFVGIISMVI